MMDYSKIGMNAKIARVKAGVTIEELSKIAGMSVTTISHLERGIGKTRIISINKYAKALGIEVKKIIYGD